MLMGLQQRALHPATLHGPGGYGLPCRRIEPIQGGKRIAGKDQHIVRGPGNIFC